MEKINRTSRRIARGDGFANVLTGLGDATRDKRTGVTFSGAGEGVDVSTRSALWRFNGLAKKTVKARNDPMFKKWITVTGDTDNIILAELDRIKAVDRLRTACRWADVYGGGIVVMGIDDGGTFDKILLDTANIRSVSFLTVYDIDRVKIESLYTDPAFEKFGEPEFYTIRPVNGNPFKVHETRVLRIDGEELCDVDKKSNKGFSSSLFDSLFSSIKNVGTGADGMARVLDEFITGVFKMEGLADLIASNRENEVVKRMLQLDVSRSIIRSAVVDKNEDYSRESASVAGMTDLYNALLQQYAAEASVPLTVLLETSAKGMNATGEGDKLQYYDFLSSRQSDKLKAPLNRLVSLILRQTQSPSLTPIPTLTQWGIEFVPLVQLSEKETVEMRNKQAATDEIYFNIGAVLPDEIRQSRFGGLSYSLETKVTGSIDTLGAGDNPDDPTAAASVTIKKIPKTPKK